MSLPRLRAMLSKPYRWAISQVTESAMLIPTNSSTTEPPSFPAPIVNSPITSWLLAGIIRDCHGPTSQKLEAARSLIS